MSVSSRLELPDHPEISRPFSPGQRALHWIMAASILAMLFIGVGMVSTVRPKHLTLVAIHQHLGVVLFMLGIVRVALRMAHGAPALPADMPTLTKWAAHLSHLSFYVLMLLLPLLGYGMLSAADYPLVVFGVRVPLLLAHNGALHALLWNAHRSLAMCFFALIVVHIVAALFHALVRRDGVFQTMWPSKHSIHGPPVR
ncbi:cytochrome b/b6 domain-containing protein [Caballeronia sp. GAFFF1]|uniref:cytochrome b n=1 Tax=Caballeronia sp. GAFFF1 TaxID=2921779 RepID=UPI002028B031|nr:cytochrome b/b6 domain-containing protein [Caballeronia sp. GAFFF1]